MCVLCRFTLDELDDFLEAAKEAIPGVREAIDAAHSHKAHQVWQHFLWHLTCIHILCCADSMQAASALSSYGLERLIHLCHGGL